MRTRFSRAHALTLNSLLLCVGLPGTPQASPSALNAAPVANAGPTQAVTELSLVTLDGTGSYDPDPGTALQYQWTHVYGPPVLLSGAMTAQPTFTAPEVAGGAMLIFELRVRDEALQQSTAFVRVDVMDAAGAPVANAGPDQLAQEGALVTLDGTGSYDPDATDVLTFQWTQPGNQTGVPLTGANTAQPTFTVPVNPLNGRLTFQLRVSDGVYSSTDTVEILVVQPDPVPVANAGPDQTVNEGSIVTLNAFGSYDPSGYSIRQYGWRQLAGPPVTLLPTQTRPQPQFLAPDVTAPTVLTFELTVWNSLYLSSTDTVGITVSPL
ncbi:hypothetical protein SAMN05444354_11982 [Stigmatella aurantiaca]|uniref:Chitinase n=1 Tax=Stigmatella aurantiaca TaxID=41 RepID=A0A1H7ZPM0_STIAU|nr:hypothetical protein [Stigmatella aurantiaca]SEM60221.1 hypothetical protein SAMN05444354_11982 [Stigmatella aurantiaca]